MKQRRQTRPDPKMLTAKTGEVDFFDSELSGASDVSLQSGQATTAPEVVGRTPYDLLHEHGIAAAVAKLIVGIDAVELLGTLAYVLLELFAKSGGAVMRFWIFLAALAGYHVVGKPLGSLMWSIVGRAQTSRKND